MQRRLVIIIFIILALLPSIASAGINIWTTNGPVGASISALVIDPVSTSTIYAAESSNIKSIDPNGSWSLIASLPVSRIITLAIDPDDPNRLYAGCEGDPNFAGGVYKSMDSDPNWSQILTNLTIYALAIDPIDPNTIYAGCKGDPNFSGGVYKSKDSGNSWDPNNTGMTSTDVRALAIDPNNPNKLYAGTWDEGIFKSTDGGATWVQINVGLHNLSVLTLAIAPDDPNILYAGCEGDPNFGGVYKSTDSGANWSQVFQTSYDVNRIVINTLITNILYCAVENDGVWKSTDGGENWFAMNTGLTNTDVQDLAIDPVIPSIIYAGTNGGGVFQYLTRDFIVSAIRGNTTEAGGTATFSVRLSSQPAADVTIGISSSNTSEGLVDPNSLTDPNSHSLIFTFSDPNSLTFWNKEQTITVTGVDDYIDDGDQNYAIVLTAATSSDPDYDGFDPNDIAVINEDNDTAGFIISTISGNTTELGGKATFKVRLSSEPTAEVTIGISSDNISEGSVDPNSFTDPNNYSLTFTFSDPNSLTFWNKEQTITVNGVDDTLVDGDQSYAIVLAVATSSDLNYDGLDPSDVTIINIDNEPAPGADDDGGICFISAAAYDISSCK